MIGEILPNTSRDIETREYGVNQSEIGELIFKGIAIILSDSIYNILDSHGPLFVVFVVILILEC
jgi:hypothetical protein